MLPAHNAKAKVTENTTDSTESTKTSVIVLSVMSFFFFLFLLLFGRFSLSIVLHWVSAHPWHCDLRCCFIWRLSKMQLVAAALFISILYKQSQHLFENVVQLLRGSFQTTWNFSLFFFPGCSVLSVLVFLLHSKIWLGKFCSDVWDGELKVSGDKGAAPIGNETWASESLWRRDTKMLARHQYQNLNSIHHPATESMGNSQCRCKYRSLSIPFYTVPTLIYQKNTEGPRKWHSSSLRPQLALWLHRLCK